MVNKRYSLLIIALYCYPGHVKGVIDHLKAINPLVDITLLIDKAEEMSKILCDKSVRIEWYNIPPVNIKWRWLMYKVIRYKQSRFFARFQQGRRYDIVNVHFPNIFMSYVYKYLRDMSGKLVITPWGSDVLRRDKSYLKQLVSLYQKADYIATAAKTPLGKRVIDDLGVTPEKLVGNFFGSDVVDYVQERICTVSTNDAKDRFGLSGRYVITCGYNRREAQRHKAIISAIDQVRDQLPDNLSLLFPMSYGADTRMSYVEECKLECEKRNIPAVFVTNFLSLDDLFFLRMATDVFVHIQTTDANSSSVKEYILCNKKIVHGSWITYEELEAFSPLFYFPVDRLEDLGEVIVKACYSDSISIPKEVLDIVKNDGWKNKATRMNDFFMSIV